MPTEKEKMLSGQLYDASDPELMEARRVARRLMYSYNSTGADDTDIRQDLLAALFGNHGEQLVIEPPFACDYGSNISVGNRVYFNFGVVILDVMPVIIGDDVLIGPNVQIYTATHPLAWKTRASGLESAKPITINSNVWIGGGAILCPGVEIGARTIIGAGSVVTRSMPPDVVAAGNPCRVIRSLDV